MNILVLYLLSLVIVFLVLTVGFFVGVKSLTFFQDNEDLSTKNITASELANKLIERNKLININITCLKSKKTNYYSSNYNVIKLSPDVKDSTSLSSLAISSHCTNQARLNQRFGFIYLIKNFFSFISKIFPTIFIPLVLISAIIDNATTSNLPALLILIALIGTVISLLIQIIILIFELNSTKKIIKDISHLNLFTNEEIKKLSHMILGLCKINFFKFSRVILTVFSLLNPDHIFRKSN